LQWDEHCEHSPRHVLLARLTLQKHEGLARVQPVHVSLGHHAALEPELLREVRDLVSVSGLLAAELVAGEDQDLEVLRAQLGQFLQDLVVLRRVAALRGHVHDVHVLAAELLKAHLVAVDVPLGDAVEVSRHGGLWLGGDVAALAAVTQHVGGVGLTLPGARPGGAPVGSGSIIYVSVVMWSGVV
jgi:hypothetical protein